MQNDLQSLADKLLVLKASIAPIEAQIEAHSELFRVATNSAGEALRFSSHLGMVETKKGSKKASKGFVPVLNVEGWNKLGPELQVQLRLAGVVVEVEQFSQDRKPSVSIKPATATVATVQAAA